MARLRFGLDVLLAAPGDLGGRRLGLVTNDAARPAADAARPGRRALLEAGLGLVRLFSPEHGLTARAADGAPVADGRDAVTGLPVVSLYGDRLAPPPEALADLDAVLFDVPDAGARFYTYPWTLTHALDACADAGVPVCVLDRPNPLGGDFSFTEGPLLEPSCYSFLGRAPIPVRHGLTLGELARYWQATRQPKAEVQVVPVEGWRRADLWPDTGLPFVPPSPALRCFEAVLLYPGLCLFEATNLSVGRGSRDSFQVVGAPWLDAEGLAEALQAADLPGVHPEVCLFTPTLPPYSRETCRGVRLVVTDARAVRPVALGLRLLALVRAHHPEAFAWASYPTAANPTGAGHFERLAGRPDLRPVFDAAPETVPEHLTAWTAAPTWAADVAPFLLYA